MTDSHLLVLLLADWLESDARLAPPFFLLYLALEPPGLKAYFLFLFALDLNEAESRNDWELDHGLGTTFCLQVNLEVEALWSCSLFIFFMELVWEQMPICWYALMESPSSQIRWVILKNVAVSRHSNRCLNWPAELAHPLESPRQPWVPSSPSVIRGLGAEIYHHCQDWPSQCEERPLLL